MYKYHQDNELLDSYIETKEIGVEDGNKVPNLTESVSVDKNGKIHITLTNLSITEDYDIEGVFAESNVKSVKAQIVTNDMKAHNTFDNPDVVKVESFDNIKASGNKLSFKMPKCSVMHIEVEA